MVNPCEQALGDSGKENSLFSESGKVAICKHSPDTRWASVKHVMPEKATLCLQCKNHAFTLKVSLPLSVFSDKLVFPVGIY